MRRHETEDSELGRMGGEEGTLIEDLICSYSKQPESQENCSKGTRPRKERDRAPRRLGREIREDKKRFCYHTGKLAADRGFLQQKNRDAYFYVVSFGFNVKTKIRIFTYEDVTTVDGRQDH
jgi:hypothetical protein